jgi:hypothetical protein
MISEAGNIVCLGSPTVSYDESPCHLGTTVVYSVKDARYYSCPVLLLVDRSQLE